MTVRCPSCGEPVRLDESGRIELHMTLYAHGAGACEGSNKSNDPVAEIVESCAAAFVKGRKDYLETHPEAV